VTLCDILGSSRIFEDLLDLTGDGFLLPRHHFGRTLRKMGTYRYGIVEVVERNDGEIAVYVPGRNRTVIGQNLNFNSFLAGWATTARSAVRSRL
jgi:hypothetical protein